MHGTDTHKLEFLGSLAAGVRPRAHVGAGTAGSSDTHMRDQFQLQVP